VITWSPANRQRALSACWHLRRACELLVELEQLDGEVLVGPLASSWRLRAGSEHMRQARGFLGAIGFEDGSRLRAGSAGVTSRRV
jgi:hypothetical protein